jgi:hypothetical protein
MSDRPSDTRLAMVERNARRLLEHPQHAPPEGLALPREMEFRIWHYPARGEWSSVAVFRPPARHPDVPWLVREVAWVHLEDRERFSDPLKGVAEGLHVTPTLKLRDSLCDVPAVEPLVKQLEGLSVPPFASQEGAGTDGVHSGVARSGGRTKVTYEWWNEGPPAWDALVQWHAKARATLGKLLEAARG